tara:strand:- start:29 stop:385 length:357 start_codon:yes stop_codon:yes gene_type:complete
MSRKYDYKYNSQLILRSQSGSGKPACKDEGRQKLPLGDDCEDRLFSVGYDEPTKAQNEATARETMKRYYYSNWFGGGSICDGGFTTPKCDHQDPNYCNSGRNNIPFKFGVKEGTKCST